MIIDSIEKFRELIPTVTGSKLDKYTQPITDATEWLRRRIVGSALMRVIEQMQVEESAPELFVHARLVVACKAYLLAIPKMDVIETANGFAVVNDEVHAPASRDRVHALTVSMTESLAEAVGGLIEFLEDSDLPEWRQSPAFTATVRNYLPTLRLFREYGSFKGGHLDYIDAQPTFRALIIKHIEPVVGIQRSADLLAQIVAGAIVEAELIENIRLALAGYYTGDMALADTALVRVNTIVAPVAPTTAAPSSPSIYPMI